MARGDAFQLQGLDGGVAVAAGETWTGQARWIQFEQPTVLTGYTGTIDGGAAAYPGITHAEGKGIGGVTTSIEVATGLVTVYLLDSEYTLV